MSSSPPSTTRCDEIHVQHKAPKVPKIAQNVVATQLPMEKNRAGGSPGNAHIQSSFCIKLVNFISHPSKT